MPFEEMPRVLCKHSEPSGWVRHSSLPTYPLATYGQSCWPEGATITNRPAIPARRSISQGFGATALDQGTGDDIEFFAGERGHLRIP